jgi:colicin import membrane protein
MTPNNPHDSREEQNDNRLSRMVAVSAVLHMVVITAIVITASRSRSGQTPLTAYTVALIDPAALGTNLSPGGGKPAEEPAGGEKPAAPRAQPAAEVKEPPAVKKETPKVVPPPQPKEQEAVKLPDKDKPVEKLPPKPEPEKAKVEEKKPEAKKPEVKPQPQQATAKPEEKKPEPAKAETSSLTAEEREKQIRDAIEKIKGKVQEKEKSRPGDQPNGSGPSSSGSGPTTLGGVPDQGGGGVVRGLEFIMYTEQVKRRVKESWIVTEKKPGLTATVRFGVQPDGEVFAIELVKRSGDRAFDESVVRAVNKANPLPPPPQTYQQEFATQKVEVTFGGEERTN